MPHDGALAAALNDTTPKAMARYLERLRETSPREKLARALMLSAQVRAAAMADVVRALPAGTRAEHAVEFVRRVYGEACARRFALRQSGR